LGDGTTVGGGTPVQVSAVGFLVMMAGGTTPNSGGRSHTCALSTIGRILCWGLNDQGQLGDGTTTDRLVPAPVLSNEVFVAVGAGDRFTCAMTPDRRVFCWGTNASGELGTGAAGGFSAVPVLVP
jgi:alpha-tubulin suppressor-like RCC1 family protein